MNEEKSKKNQSGNGSNRYRELDAPLSYEEGFKKFNKPPTGKIPKELESMLLPEPEPYKLREVKADKNVKLDVEPTVPMIPKWFGVRPLPERDTLPTIPRLQRRRG